MADRDYVDNMTTDIFFRNIMKSEEITPFFQLGFTAENAYSEYYSTIDNCQLVLPYTTLDKYACYEESVGSSLQMVSGRTVWEHRGYAQKIEYSYDYLPPDMWKSLARFLRSSEPFYVFYLPDDRYTYSYLSDGWGYECDRFVCESLTPPKMAYATAGYESWDDTAGKFLYEPAKPMWHNIQFTLRSYVPMRRIPIYNKA